MTNKGKSVAIIGSGISGLACAIKLKEAGITDFVVLEKADNVGGTWRDNVYPGVCCDVPADLYALSFAPSPEWTHRYPRGKEIQTYVEDLVDRFDFRDHVYLGDGVETAEWDQDRAKWLLRTESGKSYLVDFVVTALGQLNVPNYPDVPGIETFAGPTCHSARWNPEVTFEGKRVGVIGSAASGIQIIPEAAKTAKKVNVFQRTPNWVLPRGDFEIPPARKVMLRNAPEVSAAIRNADFIEAEHITFQGVAWTQAGRDLLQGAAQAHMEAQVSDPELRKKLTPDYPMFCRRILISDEIYPALQKSNVELITERLAEITEHSVKTVDGNEYECDVLVYATGFLATAWRWSVDVVGSGGLHLRDAWKDGAEGYYGTMVNNFPNLFMLCGPNTGLGHTSQTVMIELQIAYILRILDAMNEQGAAAAEVTAEAQARFNRELEERLGKTAWADPHCKSWYKLENGRITQNWAANLTTYGEETSVVRLEDFAMKSVVPAE